MSQRKGGITFLKVDGTQLSVKGEATYGLGKNERTAIVGQDGVHGYSEVPTAPFIEVTITDSDELSLDTLAAITDSTLVLELANGKAVALRGAWNTNKDGLSASTKEGEIALRFEGLSAEEIN